MTVRKGRSTHQGHCQACGRLQMLPNGTLSLHGYKMTHGYFSGICRGAKELPFEQSCELVQLFIEHATSQLERLEGFVSDLRQPATDNTGWFYTRQAHPRGRYYGAERDWKKCQVTLEVVPYPGGSYNKFYRDGDTEWSGTWDEKHKQYTEWKVQPKRSEVSHAFGESLSEVCTKANKTYADWLDHEVDSLKRYIKWQTKRVTEWTEQPLTPIAGPLKDDKQGFKPVEPKY